MSKHARFEVIYMCRQMNSGEHLLEHVQFKVIKITKCLKVKRRHTDREFSVTLSTVSPGHLN